jgi:hypothetical protein
MRALLLLPALLVAACGPSAPPLPPGGVAGEAPTADASPLAMETGRLLALRPLAPPDAARERVAAQLLLVAAGPEAGPGPLALEVLVRLERTGRDVALFAEADPRLRVGDRVSLVYEPRPRLRRLDGA